MSREYYIRPVEEDDVEAVMALLKKTFFIDEPLNAAVGLCDHNERCTELEDYCTHSLTEGLSYKAVDKEGNIVGTMISGVIPLKEEDNGNDLKSQANRCTNPKFQKILHILARREEGARLWEKFPEDQKLVEVKVAATDPAWRKMGIMNRLLAETEKGTLAKGIRLLRMDCSSYYSAKSAEHLGFTCYYLAKYTDITLDSKPIIVPEAPHVDDRVYVKELNKDIQ